LPTGQEGGTTGRYDGETPRAAYADQAVHRRQQILEIERLDQIAIAAELRMMSPGIVDLERWTRAGPGCRLSGLAFDHI
jgi:hypothetical protein